MAGMLLKWLASCAALLLWASVAQAQATLPTAATASQGEDLQSTAPTAEQAELRGQWRATPTPQTGLALHAALLAAGQRDDAKRLAQTLERRFAEQPVARAQLGYFWFQINEFKRSQAAFEAALRGDVWSAEQRRNLHLALASAAEAVGDLGAAIGAVLPLCETQDPAMLLRLGRLYLGDRNRPAALAVARRLQKAATTPEQQTAAEELMVDVVQPANDTVGFYHLNQAYKHIRHHDDEAAALSFERAFALGAGRGFHFADGAYAAKRIADNALAVKWFRFALDLDSEDHAFAVQQAYGFRREVETLERQFGGQIGSPFHAGMLNVWQVGVEAFWQPPTIGFRNGQVLQVLARTYENLRNGGYGAIGWRTAQAAFGVKYKPISGENLMISLEKLVAIGTQASDDWLVRLGWSGGTNTDVLVGGGNWPSWQVFSEAAWFVQAGRLLVAGEGRLGWTLALPRVPALTLTPHALLAAEYDTASQQQHALAVGPGLNVRWWFDGDAFHAPRRWLELHGSWRWGDADRAGGPMLRATLTL